MPDRPAFDPDIAQQMVIHAFELGDVTGGISAAFYDLQQQYQRSAKARPPAGLLRALGGWQTVKVVSELVRIGVHAEVLSRCAPAPLAIDDCIG